MSVAGERKTGQMKCWKEGVIKQQAFTSFKVAALLLFHGRLELITFTNNVVDSFVIRVHVHG